MRKNEEITQEILEAGLLGGLALWGGKAIAKGIASGVKAAWNSDSLAGTRGRIDQGKVFQQIMKDWKRYSGSMGGTEATPQSVLQFMRDYYDIDGAQLMAQIMTDHGIGAKGSEEKAAEQPQKAPKQKPGYVHNSNFINMDDPHLNDPSTSPQSTTQQRNAERMAGMGMKPAQSTKKRTRKESIDLSQSFSQIVEQRLVEDSRQETIARAQRAAEVRNRVVGEFLVQMAGQIAAKPVVRNKFWSVVNGTTSAGTTSVGNGRGDTPQSASSPAAGNTGKIVNMDRVWRGLRSMGVDPNTVSSLKQEIDGKTLKDALAYVDTMEEKDLANKLLVCILKSMEQG